MKEHYSRCIEQLDGWLHFAAHSHYLWPDVTRDAVIQYWDDSAKRVDRKWDYLFGEVLPDAQKKVAARIGTTCPQQLTFAPTTHEFICRLFSCLPRNRKLSVLTTDGEFHSFKRQLGRYQEDGWVEPTVVPVEPVQTFEERFIEAARSSSFDMVFFSQVFFNSGFGVVDLPGLVESITHHAELIVVDGYHSFCALPVDLSAVEERIFFLSGGYKYAQSGEGACFLHVPPGTTLRPRNTGWFAGFGHLTEKVDGTPYADDGSRFAGATQDFTGIYRMRAALGLLDQLQLDPQKLNERISVLRNSFKNRISNSPPSLLEGTRLLFEDDRPHGHFLTFEFASAEQTAAAYQWLLKEKILTDYRDDRLRFGFGLYQDENDLDELMKRLLSSS